MPMDAPAQSLSSVLVAGAVFVQLFPHAVETN